MKQLKNILEGVFDTGDNDQTLWGRSAIDVQIPSIAPPVISSINPLTFDRPNRSRFDSAIVLNLGTPGDFHYRLSPGLDVLTAITDDSGRIYGHCDTHIGALQIYSNSPVVRDLQWNDIHLLTISQFLGKFKDVEKFETCKIAPSTDRCFELILSNTKIKSWTDLYGLKLSCKKRIPDVSSKTNQYVDLYLINTPLGRKVGAQYRKLMTLSGDDFYKAEEQFIAQFKDWCPNIRNIKYSGPKPTVRIVMGLNGELYVKQRSS